MSEKKNPKAKPASQRKSDFTKAGPHSKGYKPKGGVPVKNLKETFIGVIIEENATKTERRRKHLPKVDGLTGPQSSRFHQAKKAKEHKLVADLARNEFATRLLNRALIEFVTVEPTKDDRNRTAAAIRAAKEKLGLRPDSVCKAAEDTLRVILPWAYETLQQEQLQPA